tara:strand:+ start:596 stop:952 length:357 start_codon:yes stop_codon:yes gene_type:complete
MKLTTQKLKKLIREELDSLNESYGSYEDKIIKLIASNNEENYAQAMMFIESLPQLQDNESITRFVEEYVKSRAFIDALANVSPTGGEQTRWLAKHSSVYSQLYEEHLQHLYETIEDYL